jgi:L-threonylcarbamoyladenylate synthase
MSLDYDLEAAKNVILSGGIVALPTETVYGLAASIHNEEGIKKIFAIKERPFFDPLIVHISERTQLSQVIEKMPPLADFLAKKFWPGPLTLILPKLAGLNPLITSGLETVGVRMPAHPVARALIDLCRVPLAAPSANKFGKTSPTKAEHVAKGFEKDHLMILDGGQSEVGLESTVLETSEENGKAILTILRPGGITEDVLQSAMKERGLPFEVRRKSSLASPGNIEHHYMPNIPLVIVNQDEPNLKQQRRDEICKDFELDRNVRGAELKLDSNPKLAARSLYARMREGSDSGASFIYVLRRKDQVGGLWDAIWDRLQRAASRTY